MLNFASKRSNLLFTGFALAATAMTTTLVRYVHHEIQRRGYPSWEECQCDFKRKQAFFQVWHSRHQRRGATIVTQEWGTHLINPAPWLRRAFHHGSQALAVLNLGNHYVERVTLNPQEARNFVRSLQSESEEPESSVAELTEQHQMVWRREILHVPTHLFDPYIYRLYPVPVRIKDERQAHELPVLWDTNSDMPLTVEGPLLETPRETRIDYIGWTSSQVAYCTARVEKRKEHQG
ncbi:hypothetical protein [Ktedonospora formicarum]|uniref:Uncharacterized protein n=1 Tax=Ktedonospora formicarum TaxID=2778364 RepID=A0A8J3I1C7_9CHLR|nr:hypothetical protein [Ktedonospora formicarum]GHO44985.1 hypothetical protein KSX_31480 [Ktedonospora formicarum]